MNTETRRVKILARLTELSAERDNAKRDNNPELANDLRMKLKIQTRALSMLDAIANNPESARIALPELFTTATPISKNEGA